MAEIQQNVLKTLSSETVLQKINQGKRRTHSFNVKFDDINPEFVGTVTVHHPSQMERLAIGVLKSQLLGGMPALDTMTDNLATIISTLDIVIDKKPEWFDAYSDELDYEVLEAIYVEYINWVNSFRKRPEPVADSGDSENTPS